MPEFPVDQGSVMLPEVSGVLPNSRPLTRQKEVRRTSLRKVATIARAIMRTLVSVAHDKVEISAVAPKTIIFARDRMDRGQRLTCTARSKSNSLSSHILSASGSGRTLFKDPPRCCRHLRLLLSEHTIAYCSSLVCFDQWFLAIVSDNKIMLQLCDSCLFLCRLCWLQELINLTACTRGFFISLSHLGSDDRLNRCARHLLSK